MPEVNVQRDPGSSLAGLSRSVDVVDQFWESLGLRLSFCFHYVDFLDQT